MPDVFISYNREDQHRAAAIADGLKAEGLDVWWDSHLRAGQSYDEVTEKNLREAGAVVVLWSKRSVNSKWVRAEATIGERCSTLVPAMIEDCDRPLRFELVQTANLQRWHGDRSDPNWRDFIADIKSAIGHHDSAAASPGGQSPSAPAAAAGDVTIENTFWTSIKDGTDRSDFEAYLKRYPAGHFADLARNRIAALERAEATAGQKAAEDARRAEEESRRRAEEDARRRAAAAQQQQRQQAGQQQPRPQARAQSGAQAAPRPAPQAQAPAEKKGGGAAILGLGAVIVAAAAAGAYFFLSGGDAPPALADAGAPQAEQAATADEASAEAAAADIAVNESEPASVGEVAVAAADEAQGEEPAPDPAEAEAARDVAPELEAEPEPLVEATNFSDCDNCPVMETLPGGSFAMGSPSDEPGRNPWEGPQREVTVAPFAIGKYEVTFDQWAACVEGGGCRGYEPADAGYGRGEKPVIYISWNDAQNYVDWLSRTTGRKYRLPTEAEWEYAARAGTDTAYWWGARFDRAMTSSAPVEVTSLTPNGFGLYGMLGNVTEWVADCYVNNYTEAPTDGSAVTAGDCGRRVVRGGSFRGDAADMRAANRVRISRETRDRIQGLRVATDAE